MKKALVILQLLFVFCLTSSFGQGGKIVARPTVKLGRNVGNHMVGDSIVKPIVHPTDIFADMHLIPDSPGCKIIDYKWSIMTSDNRYWGAFLVEGSTLDDKIISKINDETFIKGRIFIEDIHVRYKGLEMVANNLIFEFVR